MFSVSCIRRQQQMLVGWMDGNRTDVKTGMLLQSKNSGFTHFPGLVNI